MPTPRQFVWRSLIALVLVAFGVWGAMAVWYRAPLADTPRSLLSAFVIVAMALAGVSIIFRAGRRFTMPVAYLCILSSVAWWTSVTPSEYRDWAPDVAKRSLVSFRGDEIEVRNVRNFAWIDGDRAEERWETRFYRLGDLRTVDLFASYWMGPNVAHTIASFGFSDGRHLAFSIEIRKERGEVYDSLAGFFRQYELALIAADEADIIKVRTNRRGEDVFRYRIDVRPENARRLFQQYAELAAELDRAPQFYNTATTNCTTAPFAMLRALDKSAFPLDWRVLVSGHAPAYLYDLGFIANDAPFPDVQARARITERAKAADSTADFSAAIR